MMLQIELVGFSLDTIIELKTNLIFSTYDLTTISSCCVRVNYLMRLGMGQILLVNLGEACT